MTQAVHSCAAFWDRAFPTTGIVVVVRTTPTDSTRQEPAMTRVVVVALLLAAAGCQSNRGGLLYRKPDRADDPMFSIEEQQRRGRDRLAVVEDTTNLVPKTYVDRPGTTGR
jgi:hypothetical protein